MREVDIVKIDKLMKHGFGVRLLGQHQNRHGVAVYLFGEDVRECDKPQFLHDVIKMYDPDDGEEITSWYCDSVKRSDRYIVVRIFWDMK